VVDALRSGGATDREEVRALLVLDKVEGLGPVGIRKLVERFGCAVEALRRASGFRRPGRDAWREADRVIVEADRGGIGILTWSDDAYPAVLRNLHDPPPLLFVRGRPELLARRTVTVVGSRRATARSRDVAERLAYGLASAGVCVASGMALGVDGAAHRGALRAGGDTLAVLGRGPDEPYPPSHRQLFRDLLTRALVVSEFAPGTPPMPHHFPRRNRILAALAAAVVVVEAGTRSGALITVDHALDLGIDVWVVPGPIELAACAGSNRLLAEGARPMLSIDDFVTEIAGTFRPSRDRPTGEAGRVLSALGGEPADVDELVGRVGLEAAEVLTLLTMLEVEGSVRRLPGMRFSATAP